MLSTPDPSTLHSTALKHQVLLRHTQCIGLHTGKCVGCHSPADKQGAMRGEEKVERGDQTGKGEKRRGRRKCEEP